jgi:hypothetical protein
MGQRVLTHDPSTFLSCGPMAQQKHIGCFQIWSDLSDRIKNTAIYWNLVGLHPNIFNSVFSYRYVVCTTHKSMMQWRIHGRGTRPPEFGEEEMPM